jgi:pyruvate dehydrogenase E1 component beta subunit
LSPQHLTTKGLLIASIRDDDPVIFLEPTKLYRAGRQEVPEEPYEVPLGRAKTVREGEGVTIVAWGAMIPVVDQAAEIVGKDGIFPEVIDLRTLAPLDRESVLESVKRTGRLLIVHEAPKTCGLGSEIAAFVAEKAMFQLEAPIMRVTGQDITVPLAKGEDYYYPSPERVTLGIKKIMES